MALVAIGAMLRGGVEERLVVWGLCLNAVLTVTLRDLSWPHVQWIGFGLDAALLGLLVWIALRSAKYWPMPAAAFQLLATATHIAKLVDTHVEQWAYLSAIVIWTYALTLTLGVGVWNSWREASYRANAGPFAPTAEARR